MALLHPTFGRVRISININRLENGPLLKKEEDDIEEEDDDIEEDENSHSISHSISLRKIRI